MKKAADDVTGVAAEHITVNNPSPDVSPTIGCGAR
jgi:hypothetical protein